MARRCVVVVFPSFARLRLALAVAALICAASTTAQPQPQPLPLPQPTTTAPAMPSVPACPPAQATLFPCLAYLIGNSSSPPTECCAQMRAMFQSQAPCLCAAMASAPAQLGLGASAIGQLLPSSCDLPANACGPSGTTSSAAPADPTTTTTPAPDGTTAAAAAPESGTAGLDATAPGGGAGVKSVPGMLGSAAAAGSRGISAATLLMSSLLVVCLV